MNTKKNKLHTLVFESKDTQSKALTISRIIRQDKDAYLKLSNLQTTTNKG